MQPLLPHKYPLIIFADHQEQRKADSHEMDIHTSESQGGETSGSNSQAEVGGGFSSIISPPAGDKARLGPQWGQWQQLQQPTLCLSSSQVGFWGLATLYAGMVPL